MRYILCCGFMIEVWMLFVTLIWSVVWVLKKYLIHDAHSATVFFWERIFLLFFVCSYMILFGVPFLAPIEIVFYAALSGLCITLLNALNFRLLRQIEISSMSAIKELSRLFLGVVVGMAVFHEMPTSLQLAGVLIVAGGTFLISEVLEVKKVRTMHFAIAIIMMAFFQGKLVFEKFALAQMVPVQFVFYLMFFSLVYTTGYILAFKQGFNPGFSRNRVMVLTLSGFLLALSYVIHSFVLASGSFIMVNILITSAVVFNFLSSQAARSFFNADTEASNDGKTIIEKFAASVVVMVGLIVALM